MLPDDRHRRLLFGLVIAVVIVGSTGVLGTYAVDGPSPFGPTQSPAESPTPTPPIDGGTETQTTPGPCAPEIETGTAGDSTETETSHGTQTRTAEGTQTETADCPRTGTPDTGVSVP